MGSVGTFEWERSFGDSLVGKFTRGEEVDGGRKTERITAKDHQSSCFYLIKING